MLWSCLPWLTSSNVEVSGVGNNGLTLIRLSGKGETMPRAIEDFLAAWEALSGSCAEAGWRGIPVARAGVCDLMAARRFPGNEEALLARFPTARPSSSDRLPEGKGFEVVRADPFGDGMTWIALSRKESGSPELFAEMVGDVAGAMDAAAPEGEVSVLRTMLRRVRMWQQFMSRGTEIGRAPV